MQKWYVLSVLTGRYSNSPESAFCKDIRMIREIGVRGTLARTEAAILSDTFWETAVVQNLAYTFTINPTYLAAQVAGNDMSLLSNHISVRYLIEMAGDVHHIVPKDRLKPRG